MIASTFINPHTAFLQALGGPELLIIAAVIFAFFIIVPLIFVAIAIKKSKSSAEKDYTPYHLMEPEERLLMLQGLHAKELISEEEYDIKRKNILKELDGLDSTEDSNASAPDSEDSEAESETPAN